MSGEQKCGACGDTLEVTRYKSAGYDQPVYSFKAPCPLCVPMSQAGAQRRIPRPPPFPMHPARGKN